MLNRQCLDHRIPEQRTVAREASAWVKKRPARQIGADWHFIDARARLKDLYAKAKS